VRQQNLILILARELADKLATAVFVVDAEGRVAYFNERAADILGRTFAETGQMPLQEWAASFRPTGPERELSPEELPLVVALRQRRPAHLRFSIEGADHRVRDISVTALPLFARQDQFVGAAAIFWEEEA
jgi:PAS domain-containing protein